ncbi:MAG TPA: cellulase family glycosylhydrolase, partial [Thermomicrobiales bacterium]|nr:cellulase family glycosylhydrolase [Thermomicrobiales bacterium]
MKRSLTVVLVAMLVLTALPAIFPTANPVAAAVSLPQQRANALSPGMNLPWWFWFSGPAWDTIGTRYSRAELQGYYDAGIRGVRIPTDYYLMVASDGSTQLNATNIAKLDAAIAMCLDIGFNLIVDIHNAVPDWGGTDLSDRIENEPTFRTAFVGFWSNYAAHLSQYSADRLVLEPLNEPIFYDSQTLWTNTVAPALVASIRSQAPNHTILLSGPQWSSPLQLHTFDPATIGDSNVIFNIHFYEPFVFTHQGADWVNSPAIASMRKVPYPSSPERVAAILDQQTNQAAKDELIQYGDERWGPANIAEILDVGIDWARANNVAVLVSEFGVLRTWSDPIDRATWYRDVRVHLESKGVPWMIWSDLTGFGFDFETGSFETNVLIALGLLPGAIGSTKLTVSQTIVIPGQRITAMLSGFTPATNLQFTLSGVAIGTGQVRSDGTAQVGLRIPNLSGGARSLKVFASDGLKASRGVTITPVVRIDPASGKTGDRIRTRLYGFGKNQAVTVSIRQASTQFRLVHVYTDYNGVLGVWVTVPETFQTGPTTVLARASGVLVTV